MMNENAKSWVAALRSGEWHQVKNALRKKSKASVGFCCLGVACEMSKLGEWDASEFQDQSQVEAKQKHDAGHLHCEDCYEDDDGTVHCDGGKGFVSEEFASPLVQAWLGLSSEDGELMLDGMKTSLAQLNDAGKSFAEIADVIEANQDQLFK